MPHISQSSGFGPQTNRQLWNMSGRMKSLDASQDGLHAAYTLEFAPRRPRQRPQTATSSPSRKVGLGRETVSRICSRSRIRSRRRQPKSRISAFMRGNTRAAARGQILVPRSELPAFLPDPTTYYAKWPAFHGQGLFHRDMFPVAPPSFVYLPNSGTLSYCTNDRGPPLRSNTERRAPPQWRSQELAPASPESVASSST